MIEIPESATLARQISDSLTDHTITDVFNATQLHKFAWYSGDPQDYRALLKGRKIRSAQGCGAFVDILLDEEVHITVGDGTNLRYYASGADVPANYQLLITFDDESFLVFTVAMYGAILAYKGDLDNPYFQGAVTKPSPLEKLFDDAYFQELFARAKKTLSTKAFLATEQRIPGLGNGILQDILFRAKIHPKRKLSTFDPADVGLLYQIVKQTIAEMTESGGRDTERDLFGNSGGYKTQLSRNTWDAPCPVCGARIIKEPYLGGAVYYCPCCQPLK